MRRPRGIRIIGISLAILGWAGPALAQDAGFTPLFNGENLDGWQRFGGRDGVWTVEDGQIVCQDSGGGWLGTLRDYDDFTLRLEFRLSPGSNSGVYLRAPADTSHISRTGMEIQLIDEHHPRYQNLQAWQRTGAIYHVAGPESDALYLNPPGQWNQIEIQAQGPRVVVTLNGQTLLEDRLDAHPELEDEHPGLKRPAGRIGLQSHTGRVEFRAIQIRQITAAP